MLTFPLGARIVAIGAVVVAVALLVLGNERSVGFGIVRDGAPIEAPAAAPDLPRLLTRLRAELAIEPAQEAAWRLFEGRMIDLDQDSRRVEAGPDRLGADAAAERARHALLFAVALSDIDGALSSTQSFTLAREARVLGSSFVCAALRAAGS